MKRTTIFLAQAQIDGLARVGKEDGLCSAQLIRIALNQFFARRKRQGRK
jgi:hypothetical protein